MSTEKCCYSKVKTTLKGAIKNKKGIIYRAFHGFGQAKFAYVGSVLVLIQLTLLPQLPLKTKLDLKVVKINSKEIISLR